MGQICTYERCASQVGVCEVRASKVGAVEIGALQSAAREIDIHADTPWGLKPCEGAATEGVADNAKVHIRKPAPGALNAAGFDKARGGFQNLSNFSGSGVGSLPRVSKTARQGVGRQAKAVDIDPGQDRAPKDRPGQRGVREVDAIKIGACEVCAGEVGIAKSRPAHGAGGEVDSTRIRIVQKGVLEA